MPPPLAPDAPLAEPVLRADAELTAQRATAWREGDANVVLLTGDADKGVRFRMGAYGWRGDRMLARIEPIKQPGYTITHVSLYVEDARPLGGSGSIQAEAPRLLVTASTRGEVELVTDLLERVEGPPTDPLVRDGYTRIARHRAALQGARLATLPENIELFPPDSEERRRLARELITERRAAEQQARLPRVETEQPDVARPPQVADAGQPRPAQPPRPDSEFPPRPEPQIDPVLPTSGAVYLNADRITGRPNDQAMMLIGNVRLVYENYEAVNDPDATTDVALTAERAVIFTRGNPTDEATGTGGVVEGGPMGADQISGVYLEDNVVITDGRFTVRAPRMYFDLEQNKAILLEAVMFTWDVRRNVPLYMRADVVRQESATSFVAEDALLTTSEFAEPHVAIASDRVVLKRFGEDSAREGEIDWYYAKGNWVEVGGVPIVPWPYVAGANREIPLRRASVNFSSDNGVIVETLWDVFALANRQNPQGVELLARVDYQGDHGPGVGLVSEYDRETSYGSLNTYLLPYDRGEDDISQRQDIEFDGDARGLFRWQHRQEDLPHDLELSLEGAYVSDETFLEEFFRDEAYEAKEYETSAYLKKQEDDYAFTALAKTNLMDFTPQLTTLQAPGYTVDKLPELGYYRVGTSLWEDRLTYFSETRAGGMRIRAGEDSPADRGFGPFQAEEIFTPFYPRALDPDIRETSFEDRYAAVGLPVDDYVTRFDTRHEVDMPVEAGVVDITPYVTGRFTGYDDDFNEFSEDADNTRFWGQAGARASTEFSRSYERVDNRLFDLHRLRHLVRPNANVFGTGTSVESEDLPYYDYDVEEISDASGVRLGVVNTLQTQRGGPGRWRNVDWLTLKTDVVFLDEEKEEQVGDLNNDGVPDEDALLGRFFDYRPEFASGGDHFYTQLLWMVSDTLGVTGELTHSFETDKVVQWRIGATMIHTPRLTSFVNVYDLEVFDSQRLIYGFNYELTTKYSVRFSHQFSLTGEEADRYNFALARKLPRWLLQLVGSYDEIEDETTLGLVLSPQGFNVRSPTIPLDGFFSEDDDGRD